MSVLVFKALDYGAEKIPDRFFEKIPGGFFTPAEKKKIDKKRRDNRRRSEERHRDRAGRRSHRDRTPPTDYSDQSGYDDTDYDEYSSKQRRRRRARSLGRSLSRSLSRGRHRGRPLKGDLDSEMDHAERGPEFSPPPSEYRPYNPQEYAPAAAATGAAVANEYYDDRDRRGSSSARPDYGYPPQPLGPRASVSSSAAKYTPAGAYAQVPAATPVPQPVPAYAPYNPADYASPSPANRAPVAYYPSPPPFYRQQSRSQPSLDQLPYPDRDQVAYLEAPSRYGSTASSHHRRNGDGKHHRTRSAGHHGRSRSRVTDKFRGRFDNLDSHEKTLAASVGGALAGGLAGNALGHGALSTIVGAAIGGLGAREFEKKHEKRKVSREPSVALQSQEIRQGRHGRSPSQDRRRADRYSASDSDSDSDNHRRASRRRGSSRRRDSDY